MHDVKSFLTAVGPTASLIFAAWIFLSFLQQRYGTAYNLYRELIAEYREPDKDARRRETLRFQILEYKHRCEQMRISTQLGVVGAILLIIAVMSGGIDTLADQTWLFMLCVVTGLLGLAVVIGAALLVLRENFRLQMIIDSEISEHPELFEGPAGANKQ